MNWSRVLKLSSVFSLLILLCSAAGAAGPTAGNKPRSSDYGLSVAKRANCMGCHKWHGDGGSSYGGAAISLRKTQLTRDQLIMVIECGRPGTNMPYFHKKAYSDDRCYELTFDDFEGDDANRPLEGKMFLNDRQTKAVAGFIIEHIQGKELTREYCEKYFGGPTRRCKKLPTADEVGGE